MEESRIHPKLFAHSVPRPLGRLTKSLLGHKNTITNTVTNTIKHTITNTIRIHPKLFAHSVPRTLGRLTKSLLLQTFEIFRKSCRILHTLKLTDTNDIYANADASENLK